MDALDRALARVRTAREEERAATKELHTLIYNLIEHGERGTQAEIAKRTGYTRERLRQIVLKTGQHRD